MKFFTHEINSRTDDRVFELIDIHGLAGYGFFWVILEELYGSEDTGFQIEATNIWMKRLARSLNLTDDRTMTRYFDTLADLGLIDKQLWHERIIYSQGVMQRADAYMEKKAKEAEKKRTQRTQANKSNEACPEGVPRESLGTEEMSLGTNPMSQNVPPSYADPHSHSQTNADPKAEKNTRGEDIYTPTVENFPKPCQPTQEVLISGDMAEEKETPIPPTPLASLPPENVGLAIATTEKPKKAKKQECDLNLFLQVWNQDAPSHWVRHSTINDATAKKLLKFANEFENSLEIFQKGLWFAHTDKWCMNPAHKLRMTNVLSRDTNLIFQYYESYEDQQRRSQQLQSNTDRPMTQSDLKNAETFVRLKERLNKELLTA